MKDKFIKTPYIWKPKAGFYILKSGKALVGDIYIVLKGEGIESIESIDLSSNMISFEKLQKFSALTGIMDFIFQKRHYHHYGCHRLCRP